MISIIKKKRIIFFLPNFNRGGASESILKLSKFLVKHNFSILIISLGKNFYKKEFKKINCEIFEIKSTRTAFSILKLRAIMINESEKKFDKIIFISNINYANIISIISLLNLSNIKIILTERSSISELNYSDSFVKNLKNKFIYFLAKFFYKFSDLIITNSNFEKKYIKEKFKLDNVICIHPPSIENIIKKNKIAKLDYKQNTNIIYVGRLSKEKGIFIILKALSKIKKDYKFFLNIYGNGPEKQSIKNFIQTQNLRNIVSLKGFKKDKKSIFNNADLFINASLWEGLPNALVQSINYNVFPICSDAPGGNLEVIKNGEFGMSFKMNDDNDLKNKIIKFFNKKYGFNNKNRINHLKKFTEIKSNQKYLEILNKF